MILAILDDLLFTSKIKTDRKQLGVAISVARSLDGALAEMRAHRAVARDLRPEQSAHRSAWDRAGDEGRPALAAIPTVGFASHVQAEVIEAARRAGVDDVMARSMFTERLPQILARGR